MKADQIDKLQSKQLANVIRKLNDGKTLTAREARLIQEPGNERENFATTWDELARRLGVTRRTIQNWRDKLKDSPQPRADGRHDVAAWLQFVTKNNLGPIDDEKDTDDQDTKAFWDRQRAKLEFERSAYAFDVAKQKHVPISEITAAVGQLLAGFRTALNMLPASAARWLIGLKDFHAIKNKLQSEVDAVLQALGRRRYLEEISPAVIEQLFPDRDAAARADLENCCNAIFRELGRQALSDLIGELPEGTPAE